MQVFKSYFKIFRKSSLPSLFINLAVVLAIFSFFSTINNKNNKEFEADKPDITVYNNDNSEFTDSFMNYLESTCKIVETENTKDEKQKALFNKKVDLIITVPENFGEDFISGKDVKLDIECNPDLTTTQYSDIIVNKYLSLFSFYNKATDLSITEIDKSVRKDLAIDTPVELNNTKVSSHFTSTNLFYNFANYPICMFMLATIGTIGLSFNKKDLKRRINCSTVSLSKFNFQIILGHLCIAALCTLIVMFLGIIMFKADITEPDGYLHYINILVFSIVGLALSYMISTFATLRSIDPIANVITLGSCFLGGSFVPQEFLGSKIALTAIVNPVWWYVKANNTLSSVSVYNRTTLSPVIKYMIIELLFAAIFFITGMLIEKKKRTQN